MREMPLKRKKITIEVPEGKWHKYEHHHKGGWLFGAFLLIIGLIWLAKDMGWVTNVPIWPLALILFGIFIILGKCCKK